MATPHSSFEDADLNAFVDGRIEPSRAAELAAYLASDAEARTRVEGWKRQNETLRTLFASVLFDPVPVRLMPTTVARERLASTPPAQTETGATAPQRSIGQREPFSLNGKTLGLVATMSIGMALVGFVTGTFLNLAPSGLVPVDQAVPAVATTAAISPERAFAERAAETHQTYLTDLNRPVEMLASDAPRLLRWMQHRLAAPIHIPDLQRQGWTLIGGRIVPGQYGPAAFLVYGLGADRLGLYIARTPPFPDQGSSPVDNGPARTSVESWSDELFGYALTSGHGPHWLDRNAAALHDSIRTQIQDSVPPK